MLRLNRAEHELGADGSALMHDVLILGMTMEQVGQRRGLCTQRWQDFFARRLKECLDLLALMYGLATASRVPVKDRPR
ncbi:hypothetical protein [Bradyrhizobium brasilense]|uniref:hypothetical protein n=1 Tax=Bradyrhizobium brasilense TaxID=1419277 RepID=UPI0035C6B6E6